MDQVLRLGDENPLPWERASLTIGNFDGVHLGHQDLVRAVVGSAHRLAAAAVVLTFDPHPSAVLTGRAPLALTQIPRRARLLRELGIDHVVLMDFTAAASALSPVDFARDVVSKSLGAVHVVVGEDFRFGARRSGDASELVRVGRALGLEVEVRPKVVWRGGAVSSSRIREAVARGEVELARGLCGRPFDVEGRVIRGDGRGRQIGIPTANLATGACDAIPGPGVYAAWAIIQSGARYPAVVNTGTRPTFGGTIPRLEAHLLGFSGSLYGQSLLLQFVAHIREERRFGSAKDLVAQISRDILESQRLLELPPPFLG